MFEEFDRAKELSETCMDVQLTNESGSMVDLFVSDRYGEAYKVSVEFVGNEHSPDIVQVAVHKLSADYKERRKKGEDLGYKSPNAIVYGGEVINKKKAPDEPLLSRVIAVFHDFDGLPKVTS